MLTFPVPTVNLPNSSEGQNATIPDLDPLRPELPKAFQNESAETTSLPARVASAWKTTWAGV